MHAGTGARRRFSTLCGALLMTIWAAVAGAQTSAPPGEGECAGGPNVLCLRDNRFEVSVSWRTAEGLTGQGVGVQLTNDTGYFWFFEAGNVELLIKVLDACVISPNFWTFMSANTNVAFTLTITDKLTGRTKVITNPQGHLADSVADTGNTFPCN